MSFEELMAPVAPSMPQADSVLVFAPHPDDEVFGCGGLLSLMAARGTQIRVIVLTSGGEQAGVESDRREVESCKAASLLGYPEPEFWQLPDRGLLDTQGLAEQIRTLLEAWQPELVLAPSIWEIHPDHRAVFQFVATAMLSARINAPLWMYEVGQPLQCNTLVDITPVVATKDQAMRVFASQLEYQSYRTQIEGLNRYRTYSLGPEAESAEAYFVLECHQIEGFISEQRPDFLSSKIQAAELKLAAERHRYQVLEHSWVELDDALSAERQHSSLLQNELSALGEKWSELDRNYRAILESNSWQLMQPLRGARRKLLELKWKLQNWPYLIRVIWRHLPLGAVLKSHLRVLPRRLESAVWSNISSSNNASAHQAQLDNRPSVRFPRRTAMSDIEIPDLDLSIVTYNSQRHLSDFVKSLSEQKYPLERIALSFVDNGSTDKTVDKLLELLEPLRDSLRAVHFCQSTNRGFGAGHNLAISKLGAPFVLVVNPDTIFEPESLTALMKETENSPEDVACWESRQFPFEHPKHYDPVTLETNWCSHACVLLRRSAFDRVGRYDERIFLYGEDVEFSYRLRAYGYSLKYCPSSVIRHYTYEYSGEVKPAQYVGSLLGNFFIRARYGTWKDYLMIYPLLMILMLRRPFKGARRAVLSGFLKRFFWQQFGLRREKLYARGLFPLRGLDYSLARKGPFYKPPRDALEGCNPLPKVSVLTRTVAGRAALLRQAGASVLHQTYQNIEWIVVEDGGSEQSTVMSEFGVDSTRVRYFPLDKVGRSAAGNEAMRRATGEWLMFLDDDDLLYADHVETLMSELLANPTAAAAYSLAWEVPSQVENGGERIREGDYHQVKGLMQPYEPERLSYMNFIPIQSILFRRTLFESRGGFNEKIDHLEDWNLWSRYAAGNDFLYIERTTSMYRVPLKLDVRADRQSDLDSAYLQVKAINDQEREYWQQVRA